MLNKQCVPAEMEMALRKASEAIPGGIGYNPQSKTKDVVQELEFLAEEHNRLDKNVKELLTRLMPLRMMSPKCQANEKNKVAETSEMGSFLRSERFKVGTLNELLDECLQDLQI